MASREQRSETRAAPLYLALGVTCALGWLFKVDCLTGGDWTGSIQYVTGCYSDAVPFWTNRGIAAGQIPYFQSPMEYPVLTGGLIWIDGLATHALFGPNANAAAFLDIVTALNAALAFCVLWMMIRAGVARSRLWFWSLGPPLVLYLGHNWDMLAVAFAVAALLLARRGRPVGAAALAALGVAAKLFPILLLPLIGLQALFRSGAGWARRIGLAAAASLAAIAAWLAVNLPVALAAFANWSQFYRFSGERPGTAASLWQLLDSGDVVHLTLAQRNGWSALSFAAGSALILAFGWRRHRERLWLLFPAILAWFLLTNKVYSPQFDLWLWPMLVIACPRLSPLVLFAAGDIACYFAEFWIFAGQEGASPAATSGDLAVAAAVRAAAMLWAIVLIVRRPALPWITGTAEPSR